MLTREICKYIQRQLDFNVPGYSSESTAKAEAQYWLSRLQTLLKTTTDSKAYIDLLAERWAWIVKYNNLHRAYPYTYQEKITHVFCELANKLLPYSKKKSV